MKPKAVFSFIILVLAIIIGFILSTAPSTNPLYELTARIGHGFIILGFSLITIDLINRFLKRKHISSVHSLIAHKNAIFYKNPWILKKEGERIMISTNPIVSYLVIFGSIMGCLLVSYILLPSIDAIIAGTLEISLGPVIMIPIMVYILAALFIIVEFILILRRIRKVIDKGKTEMLIYRGKEHESKTKLQIPISNFKDSEIELAGYYQLTIPLKATIGELESFHNWIRQEKLILIQSSDERFINDLQETILMFLETA